MKKRLLYISLSAALVCGAFVAGQNRPAENVQAQGFEDFTDGAGKDVIYVQYIPYGYINVEEIVDWNTDGEELSMTLTDDTEWYAYRSKDIYGKIRAYVPKDKAVYERERGIYEAG